MARRYPALEDGVWLGLLARGAIWSSCASRLVDLYAGAVSSQDLKMTISGVHLAARRAAEEATSDQAVVALASRSWQSELARSISDGTTAQADRVLLADLDRLVRRAAAVDPFGKVFGHLESRAAAVYGDAWVAPGLSIAHLPSQLARPAADSYSISATTEPGTSPTVELWIHPDGFGPAAYAVVPYLIAHELICHVSARQRGEVDNGSVFAEGFMDRLALYFFEDWIAGIDSELAPAAEHCSRELGVILSKAATPEGAARLRGHHAADRLLAWRVAHCGKSRYQAEAEVARLGLELNLTDALLARKDAFVVRLNGQWDRTFERDLSAVISREKPAEVLL